MQKAGDQTALVTLYKIQFIISTRVSVLVKGQLQLKRKMSKKEKEPIKVILLGDSAVGKSKLVERFLVDGLYAFF
jgi:GTPase SAR1 family protein